MVRNPLDTIFSNARHHALLGHNLNPDQHLHTDFPEFWDQFAIATATNIARSHEFMAANIDKIPTLFVRYEDLVLNPETTLQEIFKFILDADSIENTVLQKRIKDIASNEFTGHPVYKLGKRSRANNVIIRTSLGSINSQKSEPSRQEHEANTQEKH